MHDDDDDRPPVIVVEDHQDSRQMLCDFLAAYGVPCVTATDGRSAIEALQIHRPCLILLDLMMPGMDGFQFRRAQAALEDRELAAVPIIVLTAMPLDIDHAARLGAMATVQKPIDLDRLLALIRGYCGSDGSGESAG